MSKIQSWSCRHLSYAGTLVLVKAVLESIQRFLALLLPIPVGVLNLELSLETFYGLALILGIETWLLGLLFVMIEIKVV